MAMLASVLAALISASSPAPAAAGCRLSASDQAWLDRSMRAWDYASTHLSGIGHVKRIEAVIFDRDCVVTSTTAMNGGANRWTARPHGGEVELPDGNKLPVGVISFSGSDPKKGNFFVMSTPSVWRAAGKDGKGTSLETLMTAVMLHEGTHVAQMPTYGAEIGRLSGRYHLPENFSDDSIQEQFGKNADFTRSIERESKLLFAASNARSRARAARLVRSALAMMKARQARWYRGKDAYLAQAEPVLADARGLGTMAGVQLGSRSARRGCPRRRHSPRLRQRPLVVATRRLCGVHGAPTTYRHGMEAARHLAGILRSRLNEHGIFRRALLDRAGGFYNSADAARAQIEKIEDIHLVLALYGGG